MKKGTVNIRFVAERSHCVWIEGSFEVNKTSSSEDSSVLKRKKNSILHLCPYLNRKSRNGRENERWKQTKIISCRNAHARTYTYT